MKRLFAVLIISIFVFSSISAIAAHEYPNPDDVGYFMSYGEFKNMYIDYYYSSRPYISEFEIKMAYEDWCDHHSFTPSW